MRWFGACLLCFFAFAPLYVGFGSIRVVIAEPSKFDFFFVLVISICAALSYFLLLLAFRAATGRGRRSDGGLLPPFAMKFFVAFFALIAVCVVAVGAYQGELRPIIGGLAYLGASFVALKIIKARETATQQGAQADGPASGGPAA